MELNEYQEKAMETCMDSSRNFSYMFLNLVGEIGEFSSKVAKKIRKKELFVGYNSLSKNHQELGKYQNPFHYETEDELKQELGDVLWQLAGLCEVSGTSLEEIAQMNIEKLASRKERGKIDGNGDNR